MFGGKLDPIHYGIAVRYPVGIIRRQAGAAPRGKAHEDCQVHGYDETKGEPAPERAFDRGVQPLARSDFLFQFAIRFLQMHPARQQIGRAHV